jgi:hypothetical protein
MNDQGDNGSNGRVTNTQLRLELENIRQEQKTEHVKTRALVLLVAAPSVAKAVPFLAGYLGIHLW